MQQNWCIKKDIEGVRVSSKELMPTAVSHGYAEKTDGQWGELSMMTNKARAAAVNRLKKYEAVKPITMAKGKRKASGNEPEGQKRRRT